MSDQLHMQPMLHKSQEIKVEKEEQKSDLQAPVAQPEQILKAPEPQLPEGIFHEPAEEIKVEFNGDFDEVFSRVFGMDMSDMTFEDGAKAYGMNRISDLFYIDGKRSTEALKDELAVYEKLHINSYIAFSVVMADVIREGKRQITVANWQVNRDGFAQATMTDLNISSPATDMKSAQKSMAKAKKSRKSRFEQIKKDMEKNRRDIVEEERQRRRRQQQSNEIDRPGTAFLDAADIFMEKEEKDRSDEFIAVKRALDVMYRTGAKAPGSDEREALIRQLSQGRFTWSPESYQAFSNLWEALTHYIAGHLSAKSKDGIRRSRAARQLLEGLKTVSINVHEPQQDKPLVPGQVSSKERSSAESNVKRMVSAYRAYSRRVGEDMIASADEKLKRRWDMLKNVEQDIRIFEFMHKNNMTPEQSYLVEEYHRVRAQIALRDHMKESGKIPDMLTNHRTSYIREETQKQMGSDPKEKSKRIHSENGLSAKQLAGVREIDHWILRNFQNGGYMSFGYNTIDRSDIASRLMAMSVRQRLYVYYIVSHPQARKSPAAADAVISQTDYVPDVSVFKDQIIPTMTKFYTRFSGGYVYWNKMTQAMAICEGSADTLDSIDALENKEQLKDIDENEPEDQAEYSQKMDELLLSFYALKDKLVENNNGIAASPASIKKQKESIQKQMNELLKLQEQIEAKIPDMESRKVGTNAEDVANNIEIYSDEASRFKTFTYITRDIAKVIQSDSFNKIGENAAVAGEHISVVGGLIGQFIAIRNLKSKWKNINDSERGRGLAKIVLSFGNLTKSTSNIIEAFGVKGKAMAQLTGPAFGAILTEAGLIISATAYAENNDKRKLRKNALKNWKKEQPENKKAETAEERYQNGLARLDQLITKKEGNDNKGSVVTAGISVSTLLISLGGLSAPLTGGLSAVLAAGGFAVASLQKAYNSLIGRQMRREVVGSFFDVDDMVREAQNDWRREHDGEEMSQKQKDRIREQILYRIAADLGYYSPSQLSHELAKGYGEYLLNGARMQGEQRKTCIDLIKGLGLRFSIDKKTKEIKNPKASDIAKKLCA